MAVGMLSRCLLFEGQMWAYPVTVTDKNNIRQNNKISTFTTRIYVFLNISKRQYDQSLYLSIN